MATSENYKNISRPYNNFLERDPLAKPITPGSSSQVGETAASTSGANGNVEPNPISGDTFGDVWIENFIRSKNWKPREIGFDIEGKSGYAEFADIFITGGNIGGVDVADIGTVANSTPSDTPSGLTCVSTGITIGDDGTQSAYAVLNWTAVTSTNFSYYVIRHQKNGLEYYTYATSASTTATIDGLLPGIIYNFGVASVNKSGGQSSFCTDISVTMPSDSIAPATVQGVSATAGIQYIIVKWTHNAESDLASYNIYRNIVNDSSSSSLVGNIRTSYFIDGGLTGDQLYYYWIRAVDTSNNVSENFSDVVSATPRNVASSDTNIAHQGWNQTCVFSSTDTDTVSWALGVFTASDGTSYNIAAGNTGAMANRTFIYLDIGISLVAYQKDTNALNAVGDGKVLIGVAENGTNGRDAVFQIFGGSGGVFLDGSDLVAESITTNEIAANTIQAGNIEAGTITATEIDTDTITSLDNLVIAADQILIDGAVYLTNWRHGSDLTKIDGGNIFTGSVTTTQLNFTPVATTNIIASINASEEAGGLKITAARISINGTTTFSDGFNPSEKRRVFTSTPTTPYDIGDLWVDGSVFKKCKTQKLSGAYDSANWELSTSYTGTFAQATIPTSIAVGDLWVDTDDGNKIYRAASVGADQIIAGEWVLVRDTGIAEAIAASADAQATADGKIITFAQSAIPTSEGVGDLWIDTDDGNKTYRAAIIGADQIVAGEWEPFRDTTIADAQATADGKIVSFYQDEAPIAEGVGDLWFDTDDNERPYRWSGGAWVAVPDSNKLESLGGAYGSASSGARVLIFPPELGGKQMGIQVIDDDGNDVFAAYVFGAGDPGIGDVILGDYGNDKGVKWDKSAGTFFVKGSLVTGSGSFIQGDYVESLTVNKLEAGTITSKTINLAVAAGTGNTYIAAGKTTFDNTVAGFILGIDDAVAGDPAKFLIGDATTYLNWTGSALAVVGAGISATAITGGTIDGGVITGATIQSDAINRRIRFSGANSKIQWLNNDSEEGYIYNDGNGNMTIDADNLIYIVSDGAGDDIFLQAADAIALSANAVISFCTGDWSVGEADNIFNWFNSDSDNSQCIWVDDGGGDDPLMRLKSSDECLYIDGQFFDTGADFAEFFEAIKEFSREKIPNGVAVVLVGDKIRPSNVGEIPIGVISANPTIVGNAGGKGCGESWGGKYLKDDFGNYIMEEAEWWTKEVVENFEKETGQKGTKKVRLKDYSDRKKPPVGAKKKMVMRKKINPEWNPKQKYIPRKERPEWNVVGLMGRIRLKKGQPVAPTWIKIRDISNQVEEWLIK